MPGHLRRFLAARWLIWIGPWPPTVRFTTFGPLGRAFVESLFDGRLVQPRISPGLVSGELLSRPMQSLRRQRRPAPEHSGE